ncbi:cytidine deaminase [Vallicoccus soli]|uniref:Cytidine deaminase n=1 Tax=Vallicoccus soli TaxID=2339232 RepID=A0A3A3Z5Q0_9ACTN|nr:cytidine deaminase [Vallicoccus soli]RJK97038.1 cytidine deaminase [Vallicoccus soli]
MPEQQPASGAEGLAAEDQKLVTLARAARARLGVPDGAAVRDGTGRTYVAGTVALAALRLSALEAAVAAAVSSGADALEGAAVVGAAGAEQAPAGVAAVSELAVDGAAVVLAGPDGAVLRVLPAGPAGRA